VSDAARCIVLGGSGVVGRALVSELAASGARVGFTYRNGEAAARELRTAHPDLVAERVDLSDVASTERALDALADQLGGVDALVHCAVKTSTVTPALFDDLGDVDLAGWDEMMRVNVMSAFVAVRRLLPRFPESGGNIVLFGSVDGIKPVPSPVPYATSKAAGRGMVLSLAKALGEKSVRVNMVAPGVLEDGASRTLPEHLRKEYLRHAGLRRVGKVAEVTAVAAWFATVNTYVTGQVVLVDGGL